MSQVPTPCEPTVSAGPRPVARVLAVVLVFLITLVLRWITLGSLGGDDHWSLWTAATFLKGDRPFLEFAEPGDPLYWAISALAQVVTGYRPIGEVGLGFVLMAGAVATGFALAWRASRSFVIAFGLAITAAVLLSPTKLYSYPKVFIYPMAIGLGWHYIDRPTWRRAMLLALGVAIAWGYRHDHGAYVAVGASAAVLAAHWRHGFRTTAFSLGRVGAFTILLLSPYFALIQANEGLVAYFRERIAFAAKVDEAGRRAVPFVVRHDEPFWFRVAPQTPVSIAIEWKPGTPPPVRAAAEQRYGLVLPPPPPPSGWQPYLLTDRSTENLTALMAERRVVTVDGLTGSFRQGFVVEDAAGGRGTITVTWKPGTDDDAILADERRFRLSNRRAAPTGASPTTYLYDIDDVALGNVTAIHESDHTVSVGGTYFVRVPVVIGVEESVPDGPDVRVRWASDDATMRAQLESKYRLRRPRLDNPGPAPTWVYELGDRGDANVAALLSDPAVQDTAGFDPGEAPNTRKAPPWTPPTGVHIAVLWKTPMAESARKELEQRYHLVPTAQEVSTYTAYYLTDARPENMRALLADPAFAHVNGVDETTMRPERESWMRAQWRTFPVLRIVPLPRLFHAENAGVWLYYVSYGLPFLVLLLLAIDVVRRRAEPAMPLEGQKMFAAAVLMAVANLGLMRKLGYFPDHADAAIILGAWVLGRAYAGRGRGPARRVAAGAVAGVVTLVSVVAASSYVDLPTYPDRYNLDSGPTEIWSTLVEKVRRFARSPAIDGYAPADAQGDLAMIRYLYECTRADDRILVTSDVYTIPYYTERRVVGHIFWQNGFMTSPAYQRRMIDLMERDPVPIVFSVGGEKPLDNLNQHPLVRDYVAKRFTDRHAVLQDHLAGKILWVLVDNRRTPTGTYASMGLPCFR